MAPTTDEQTAPVAVGDTITIDGVDGGQTVTSVGPDGTILTEPAAASGGKPGDTDQPGSVNPGLPAGVTDQATGDAQASGAIRSASQTAAQASGQNDPEDPTDPGLKASGAAALDSPPGGGA